MPHVALKIHLTEFLSLFLSFCLCYALVQDHAPGLLLVEEAGGVITDSRGRPLDFGLGRTLGTNFGVVAARKEVHAQVIEAVQAVLAAEATQGEGGEESVVRFPPYFLIFGLFDQFDSSSSRKILAVVEVLLEVDKIQCKEKPDVHHCIIRLHVVLMERKTLRQPAVEERV